MQSPVLDNLLQQNFSGLPVKDFLQRLTEEHPYFSPAHFFLLQQLNEPDSGYSEQAAKTALLFNNPYWLNFKLHQEQPQVNIKEALVVPMYTGNTDDDAAIFTSGSEKNVDEITGETKEAAEEETPPCAENTDNDDAAAVLVPGSELLPGEAAEPVAEAEPLTGTAPAVTATDQQSYPENTDNDDDSALLVKEELTPAGMPQVKIDLAASIKNAENENALAFEPMHLVDYFASQGIKLSEEVQPADKLGKQLKSFTEWLKTMKKVHVPDNTASSSAEITIQALAEKSNAENEVITEAMADVFTRQGKASKAIELYEKLSLLNPAKSAYFAAKIENLKGQ